MIMFLPESVQLLLDEKTIEFEISIENKVHMEVKQYYIWNHLKE